MRWVVRLRRLAGEAAHRLTVSLWVLERPLRAAAAPLARGRRRPARSIIALARLLSRGRRRVTGSVGGVNRVRIPRRLATLAAGVAILPLGAVVAVSVAASPSAAAAQTHASATGSLLRFHLLPLSLPLAVGPAAPSPPYVMVIPPAPKIAPFEEIAGTEVPGNTYTAAQVETIITAAAEADGVDPAWMIATATCESNLHPNSYNPSGPYYGLFQFLMSTFRAHGGTSIWDPVQQAQIAASMFASGDSSAWPICSLR